MRKVQLIVAEIGAGPALCVNVALYLIDEAAICVKYVDQ